MHAQSLSCVQLFATPSTIAHQAPLSMGFARQEYWSGSPFSSPGSLPDSGIELMFPALAGGLLTTWEAQDEGYIALFHFTMKINK